VGFIGELDMARRSAADGIPEENTSQVAFTDVYLKGKA